MHVYLNVCAVLLMGLSTMAASETSIVFLHGDRSHKSGEHEFRAGSMLLADHLNRQDAVPVNATVHHNWPADDSILDNAAAIVIYCDATKVIADHWERLDQLCRSGVGLMLLHYAVHPREDKGEQYFMPWVGGYFSNAQSVNPFWAPEIEPLENHEVARGIRPFRAIDEFYFNLKFDERVLPFGVGTPDETNLVRVNNIWTVEGAAQKGHEQVLLWGFERDSAGRGAGFTGGHNHCNWAIDDYRRLVLNTIVWVAGQEVPQDGLPSPSVTREELNANLDEYPNGIAEIEIPTEESFNFEPGRWEPGREKKK